MKAFSRKYHMISFYEIIIYTIFVFGTSFSHHHHHENLNELEESNIHTHLNHGHDHNHDNTNQHEEGEHHNFDSIPHNHYVYLGTSDQIRLNKTSKISFILEKLDLVLDEENNSTAYKCKSLEFLPSKIQWEKYVHTATNTSPPTV